MPDNDLLKPVDVARIFGQSLSWISKNHKKLGGVKIGGRMFFPPKEVLYERLFCREKGLAIRLHDEGREIHTSVVQDQERGQGIRTKKAKRIEQTNFNRHGLFTVGESTSG